MARVMITLQTEERDALVTLAKQERRDPRQQAALLIRRELERVGLLRPEALKATGNAQPRREVAQ